MEVDRGLRVLELEKSQPDLLVELGQCQVEVFGVKGTISDLAKMCPIDLNDPRITLESKNEFVIKAANEACLEVPKAYENVFNDVVERLEIQKKFTVSGSTEALAETHQSPTPETVKNNPLIVSSFGAPTNRDSIDKAQDEAFLKHSIQGNQLTEEVSGREPALVAQVHTEFEAIQASHTDMLLSVRVVVAETNPLAPKEVKKKSRKPKSATSLTPKPLVKGPEKTQKATLAQTPKKIDPNIVNKPQPVHRATTLRVSKPTEVEMTDVVVDSSLEVDKPSPLPQDTEDIVNQGFDEFFASTFDRIKEDILACDESEDHLDGDDFSRKIFEALDLSIDPNKNPVYGGVFAKTNEEEPLLTALNAETTNVLKKFSSHFDLLNQPEKEACQKSILLMVDIMSMWTEEDAENQFEKMINIPKTLEDLYIDMIDSLGLEFDEEEFNIFVKCIANLLPETVIKNSKVHIVESPTHENKTRLGLGKFGFIEQKMMLLLGRVTLYFATN